MAQPHQRVTLITGANQGLGYEAVKRLASQYPDNIVLLGSRSADKGKAAADTITQLASGSRVVPFVIDIDSDASIAAAVKTVEQDYGRLDVLYHNAAVAHLPGTPREVINAVMQTNASSTVLVTDAFLPLLRKAKVPRILFMSSGLGSLTLNLDPSWPFYGIDEKPYIASKAAMNMIGVLYLAQLGKEGFKINVLNPGWRATGLNGYAEGAGKAEDGIVEAVKLVVDDDPKGVTGQFVSDDGAFLPW